MIMYYMLHHFIAQNNLESYIDYDTIYCIIFERDQNSPDNELLVKWAVNLEKSTSCKLIVSFFFFSQP